MNNDDEDGDDKAYDIDDDDGDLDDGGHIAVMMMTMMTMTEAEISDKISSIINGKRSPISDLFIRRRRRRWQYE